MIAPDEDRVLLGEHVANIWENAGLIAASLAKCANPNSYQLRDASFHKLQRKTAELLQRLNWNPEQLPEIHALYAKHLKAGLAFPIELEEHSLRLILKFIRPDDGGAAHRLIEVLRLQGKTIPSELQVQDDRASPPEHVATRARAIEKQPAEEALPPLYKRVLFVVGLPKSASRLMVKVLAEMQPDERFRKPATLPYASDVAEDVQADLRYHDLAGFTGGGIIHSHMSATDVNRYVLARLGLGGIITVRHPADHIAALYCHIRGLLSARDKSEIIDTAPTPPTAREDYVDESKPSQLYYHGVIFPVDPRFFGLEASVDDAITHLIAGGYLFHALSWIVSWQLFRVRNISMIVRYEDFLSEPQELIQRINARFFDNHPDAASRGIATIANTGYVPSFDASIYPRGHTGGPGIWKCYFSRQHRRSYNEVCRKFTSAYPYASLLNRLYGNLFVDE